MTPHFRRVEQQFWRFHAANPHVFQMLVEIARDMHTRGRRPRYSMYLMFERLRWLADFETKRLGDEFKLNNTFRPIYARLVLLHTGFDGFFELRRSHFDAMFPQRGGTDV